jgi:hypothetical protein
MSDKIIEQDTEKTQLVKELRCAERNVEVLANLCDYLSQQVSEYTRHQVQQTLHHIEHLYKIPVNPNEPKYGSFWVYERPIVWRDQARYEDAIYREKQKISEDQVRIGVMLSNERYSEG